MNVITKSALAGLTSLSIAAGASASVAPTPAFPAFNGPPSKNNPVVKPSQIIYSGDGSHFFAGAGKRPGKLHWTVWNSTEGLGTGQNWINNCSPNCAAGKFSRYAVTLKVYRPKKASKFLIFTRLKVTYTGKQPGNQKSFTWKVSYNHGIFLIG